MWCLLKEMEGMEVKMGEDIVLFPPVSIITLASKSFGEIIVSQLN